MVVVALAECNCCKVTKNASVEEASGRYNFILRTVLIIVLVEVVAYVVVVVVVVAAVPHYNYWVLVAACAPVKQQHTGNFGAVEVVVALLKTICVTKQ